MEINFSNPAIAMRPVEPLGSSHGTSGSTEHTLVVTLAFGMFVSFWTPYNWFYL